MGMDSPLPVRRTQTGVSPRVLRILSLIQCLEPQERAQLGQLLPLEVTSPLVVSDEALAEAVDYFQEKAGHRSTPPSLDDPATTRQLSTLFHYIVGSR